MSESIRPGSRVMSGLAIHQRYGRRVDYSRCISGSSRAFVSAVAADQLALEMALEVGQPQRARDFVAHCLATRRKMMGMGHREYRVVDPRARMIKDPGAASGYAATAPEAARCAERRRRAAFIDQTGAKQRSLRANLQFYKGVAYLALDIPKEYFTASFAAALVRGLSSSLSPWKDRARRGEGSACQNTLQLAIVALRTQ